ncbi:MAG: LPS export ABC transporter permease LptF [Deltaproteobacteria bacterium]|nr:LPS export ABC transporter permease LptF [Deltaproteobacteria bacterium]
MPIIDRYIIREISRPMLVVCFVLLTIFASYSATRFLTDATAGILPAATVFYLVGLKMIIALEVLLPITLYLSIIVGLGRLHSDNEMAALHACGISDRRIYLDIFAFALLISLLVATLSLAVRPWAYQLSYRLKNIAKASFQISRMDSKSFYEFDNHRRVIFADRVDPRRNRVGKVFIRSTNADGQQLITARSAVQRENRNGRDVLIFIDGRLYNFNQRGQRDTVASFQKYTLAIEPPVVGASEKIKAAATRTLLKEKQRRAALAELQWRLSTPFTTILLALLGIPLSQTTPRRGKYGKTVAAVALYGLFYALSLTLKSWVAEGVIEPFPGLWWVQLLMFATLLLFALNPFSGGTRQ